MSIENLPKFFYINHHDRIKQQDNDIIMKFHREGNKLHTVFAIINAIKVDTNDEKANKLMQEYNKLIDEQGIRKWGSDYAEDDLYKVRDTLIEMAKDSKNKAVNVTKIIEPNQPYGKNWKDYLPPSVKDQLDESEDPRLREEQANIAHIKAQASKPYLSRDGHKPPTTGGYKKSYGKKKKTKKTRRKTKNMRKKSKSKSKTKKKSTRKKKHYKKRKSKTHKKR